jgi:uncharacterized protein YdeI (YjbR/CyaY-like superfamily)
MVAHTIRPAEMQATTAASASAPPARRSSRDARLVGVPSVVPNPKSIRPFVGPSAFEAWLSKNHDRQSEVWIKIYKKGSGKPSIDASQAIDVALCWGWIDGIRKAFDEEAFLQRYTPRKAKSRWSQINVERVRLLSAAGRMTEHGQLHVDAAKADGRWAAAYPAPSALRAPEDFLAAVSKNRAALDAYRALGKQAANGIAYRLHHIASAERRRKFIDETVVQLSRASTLAPLPRHEPSASRSKPSASRSKPSASRSKPSASRSKPSASRSKPSAKRGRTPTS